MTRSKNSSRGDAEPSLEKAREVRLVGESGAERDLGERGVGGVEQTAGAVESEGEQVLVRCPANGLLERAREMRRRQACLTSQEIDRQRRRDTSFHELGEAAPDGRSEERTS